MNIRQISSPVTFQEILSKLFLGANQDLRKYVIDLRNLTQSTRHKLACRLAVMTALHESGCAWKDCFVYNIDPSRLEGNYKKLVLRILKFDRSTEHCCKMIQEILVNAGVRKNIPPAFITLTLGALKKEGKIMRCSPQGTTAKYKYFK